MKKQMLILGGPTGSGKSSLALELALYWRGLGIQAEILCADSITLYRGFDIGSSKPSRDERNLVPHHLLDLVNPCDSFTAGDFLREADRAIQDLQKRSVLPIVVGGSGFYLRALLRGMSVEENSSEAKAAKLFWTTRAEAEGWPRLYEILLEKDPDSRQTIHPNDHYRIIRALQAMEIQKGKTWSQLNREARNSPPRHDAHYFYLNPDRSELRQRVQHRTQKMLAMGLQEEVRHLLEQGIPPSAKPMQSVGYRECVQCLQGEFSATLLEEKIIQSTMQLARHQATWFRGEELATALCPPPLETLKKFLEESGS